MSSEVLLTFNGALAAEVAQNITKISDALSSFEGAIKLAKSSLGELTDVENASTLQTAKFEKALGLSSSAMLDMKKETDALVKVINKNSEAFENNKAKADLARGAVQAQIDKYKKFGVEVPDSLKKVSKELNKASKLGAAFQFAGEAAKKLDKFVEVAKNAVSTLSEIGVISKGTASDIGGMLDGVSAVSAGLAMLAANPVLGTIQLIIGGIKLLSSVFKFFAHKSVRDAIDEERKFIEISEETQEKIVELHDTLGDAHAATSMYMDEIVKGAKINMDNFDKYANRTAEILDDYNNKTLGLTQTQEAIGKSFTALLEQANKVGSEGSAGMVSLIQRVRESGIQVAEIQEYVNQKLTEGVEALGQYLSTFDTGTIRAEIEEMNNKLAAGNLTLYESIDIQEKIKQKQAELASASADVNQNWDFMQTAALTTFSAFQSEGKSFIETVKLMGGELNTLSSMAEENGLAMSGSIKEMTDMSSFINQNETLVTRIDATNKMMSSLNDSAHLTRESFSGFSTQAVSQFDALIKAGATEQQALQMLGPQLQKLHDYAINYNVAIDEQTKKLIEKGQASGVIAKQENEVFNIMNDLLLAIADKMGAKIPESAKNMAEKTSAQLNKIKAAGEGLTLTINTRDATESMEKLVENVRNIRSERFSQTFDMEINLNDDQAKRFLEIYQPVFQDFLAGLKKEHGVNIDLTNASKAWDSVSQHMETFEGLFMKEYEFNIGSERAQEAVITMLKSIQPLAQEIEKERQLKVASDEAKAKVQTIPELMAPFIRMIEEEHSIKLDPSQVKKALKGAQEPLKALEEMFQKEHGIKIDIASLKATAQMAVTLMAPFKSIFGDKIKMPIDFEGILAKIKGIEEAKKKIDEAEEKRAAKNNAWRKEVNKTARAMNLMAQDAVDPMEALEKKTKLVLQVVKEHSGAWENNKVGAEKMTRAIRAQLDEYDKYEKEVPPKLRAAAEAHEVLSTKQEQALKATNDLKNALGDLSSDNIADLNAESKNLVDYIKGLNIEMDLHSEKGEKVKNALSAMLAKYGDLSKAPEDIKELGVSMGLLEVKTNQLITPWGLLEVKTYRSIKAMNDLDKSMGFILKGDVEKGANEFTDSLKRNAEQLERNPESVQKLYNEMVKLEKEAIIAKAELPKTWQEDTKALREAYKATEEKEKKNDELADTYGYTAEQIEKLSKKEREAAEAMSETVKGIMDIGSALGVSTKDMQGFAQGWISLFYGGGSITDKMQTFGGMVGQAGSMLKDMGIVSGSAASRIALVGQGIGQVGSGVAGLVSGNPMKMIEGVIKIAKGIGNIIKGLFGDKWERRAKKALKGLEGVTDEMTQQLKKKAKEMGSTTLAMNELMASFIKQAAITTEKGLEGWSGKVVGMMDQLKNVSGADAAKLTQQIGDSFSAMVEKADKLDLHGSKAMVSMIRKARELNKEGKKIPEVFEYVNERLTKGAEAISTYIGTFGDVAGIQGEIAGINDQLRAGNVTAAEAAKLQGELGGKQAELNSAVKDIRENWDFIQTASLSTFTAMMDSGKSFVEVVREMGDQLTGLGDMAKLSGMEISGGLKEMTDLADFVQQNEKLATRIEATNQMMEALGDTSYMTAEDFTNFSTNAQKQFDDLINAGATEKQALRLLGPQLENLIKYQKTYGLTIDEQTNSLINRAKQEGVLGKQAKTEGELQIDLQERMVSILEGIGEHFGVKIPRAMDEMASTGESSMSRLEAHWEGMGYDVDEMRERIGKHLPFGYRAMMEAATAANRAAQDAAPIESIDQWKFSLGEVEETIRTNLLEANQELDAASQTAIGNIINYLKNTSEEGSNTTMTFGEIKEKIEELGGSYETLLGESPEAFLEISDKMKEKIDELTLTMGDSHAATSTLMSQIIAQADIDVTNFDLYAARTGEIIEDYKNGALDLEQTTEAMGAAFNNILGEAQRLGTEGSEQMVGMLQAAREAGVEVAEMHEYVNSKLQDGVTSLATYIKSFEGSEEKGSKKKEEIAANWEFMQSMALASFNALEEQGYSFVETLGIMQQPLADLGKMARENGLEVSEGLRRMTNIATFNEQNQALMSRIEATRGMMEALGDSAFLTANDFAMFAQQTTSQFDEVLAKSGDQETAMRLVAPALQDLIKYADSYGFVIDDNTQALIDQGIQQGLVSEQTKTDSQVTNDLLMLIAETLGATIPENLANLTGQVTQSMTTIEGQTGAWGNSLDQVRGKLSEDLPGAVRNLDQQYTDAFSGHSIVTETEKWRTSLSGADEQLKGQLPGSLQAVKSVAENTFSGAGDKTALFGKKVDDLKARLKGKLTASLQELEQKGGGAFDKLKEKGGIFAGMADRLKEKTKKELTEALVKLEQKGSGAFDLLAKKTSRMTAVTGETTDKIKIEMLDALKKAEIQGTRSLSMMVKETGTWQDKLSSVKSQLGSDLPGAVKNLDKEYTEAMTGHSVVTETAKWSDALRHVRNTIDTDLIGSTGGLDKSFAGTMSRIKDKLGDMEKDLQRTAIEGGNLDEVFREYASSLGISTGQLKTLLGESSGGVIEISEEMQKKINELTETMGDAHAAESTLVNEIIRDAEINVNNFDAYARRTREILTDYASGALDLKQTQEAMGSAFGELLKKAQELGTEGSKQMIALLKDVRTSGIEVAEMQDYVNDKLNKGVEALDKYITSFKSTTTLTDEYDDLNKKLSDNLEALEKVEAEMFEGGKTQQELNELRKEAARLEEERAKLLDDTIAKENELGTAQKDIAENWDFMQAAALSTFKALESEGHSFVEIVGMMDGQLTNLAQMAGENGLTVSEGIKEMTDMAGFVEQNEGLANRIDATKTMMEALGDTAYMKASDFAMFSDQTKKQFDEIIAKGGDSQMALRLMAPALEDLVKYSESYGYTIDANTRSLIDQAREQGLLSEQQKTDAQVTNDILLLIAETLGAVIPESLQETTGAIQSQQESFGEAAGAMTGDLAGLGQAAIEKGAEVREGLDAMTDREALSEYTGEMLQDIEETRNQMAYLGESALLTDEQFAGFSENIQERFMNIAAKTGDSETALRLLGPALEDVTTYSERYGFAIDENTRALIDQANQQEILAKETGEGTKAANEHLMEMAKKYGLEIPGSLKVLTGDVNDSMKEIEEKTGDWNSSLDDVEGKIKEDLPKAIRDLDADYTDAMTGHSIVTETGKWKHSLEDVNHILGRELLETAENLDQKYKHVSGNIYEYLQKTSKGGYMARMSFDKMVNELERVKNAYDKMALKRRLSDKDKNIMEDYRRQIQELSEAIEETAPTLENFGKKFKEFQDRLAGDIGVNRGMIEMARGLREQGQSLKEIDDIIDKSLTGGSKGLGAWVDALGPAKKEIEELKKLQEDIGELREKEELKEEELAKLEKMEADLLNRRTGAQKLFLDDQEELLNTQDMVVAYFHSMRAEGKSVSEIMETMGDSFENLAEKSMAQLTGTAGFEMTGAFSNLYDMQRKMADNEDLIEGVEGLTQALHGMGDSMLYMSDEEFGRFETSAVSAFKKLKDAGFDQKQSLQLIAPMLKDLRSYAAEYGFSLDQSTARMLKNAKEEGVLRKKQKSDTEKLVEVNRQLAGVMERLAGSLEKLGAVSPFAQLADEARALETQTARLKGFERQRKTVAKDIELAKSQAQRLIDDLAAAGGDSTQTGAGLFELLLKKEEELEKLIKKQTDIEKGYNRTRAEVERLREEYNKNMPKEGGYISAALGYHDILKSDKWFRLHKGEQVDVWTPEETRKIQATPIRRMNLSDSRPAARDGDIVFEHITIQSENGEEAVKDFMTAIKGNKYGVQNLIRKVAH